MDFPGWPDLHFISRLTPCPTCNARSGHIKCACGGRMCRVFGIIDGDLRGWRCVTCAWSYAPGVAGWSLASGDGPVDLMIAPDHIRDVRRPAGPEPE